MRNFLFGEFTFARLDLGSFRVVVTPPGGAATSRSVVISRGGDIREIHLGLAPPPAAFAALGSDMPNRTGARPIKPLLTSPAR